MLTSVIMTGYLAASLLQSIDPLLSSLAGQIVPENQSITVCPDGVSAFRMMRDGYSTGLGSTDRYFSALRANRCEQLAGPAIVVQVLQIRRVPGASASENVFALVRAEDENGRDIFGIYQPSLSERSPVDTVLESALNHTTNGVMDEGSYYICPDVPSARRAVRNVPAKGIAGADDRLATFESNIAIERCAVAETTALLTDAFEFSGFDTSDSLGGWGAYSGEATDASGRRIAVIFTASF